MFGDVWGCLGMFGIVQPKAPPCVSHVQPHATPCIPCNPMQPHATHTSPSIPCATPCIPKHLNCLSRCRAPRGTSMIWQQHPHPFGRRLKGRARLVSCRAFIVASLRVHHVPIMHPIPSYPFDRRQDGIGGSSFRQARGPQAPPCIPRRRRRRRPTVLWGSAEGRAPKNSQ